jgi:hypothetical protein
MSNEKQTTVDWLLDRIEDVDLTEKLWENVKQQAKEMHKKQMCKFAYKCHNHYKVYGDFNIEQYYEQTYGGNK